MEVFPITVVLASFLCSLVAGFLFAFSVVTMPGIRNLKDAEFLRAFQVMDRVIQDNQPIFMLVWVGSVLALLSAAVLGVWHLEGDGRLFLIVAAVVYLVGVQLPTATINIPLNNQIQTLNVANMDETAQGSARRSFESRWNFWNSIRTIFACLVSLLLIVLMWRL